MYEEFAAETAGTRQNAASTAEIAIAINLFLIFMFSPSFRRGGTDAGLGRCVI